MCDFHGCRHAVQHDDLVAPVEPVGFARREGQRDKGVRRRARIRLRPGARVAADSVIAAFVGERPQLLEKADQGRPLRAPALRRSSPTSPSSSSFYPPSFGRGCIRRSKENDVSSDRRTFRTVLRDSLRSRDLLDRLGQDEVLAPYLTDRLHTSVPRRPLRRITDEGAQLSERPLERPLGEARVVGQEPRRSSRWSRAIFRKRGHVLSPFSWLLREGPASDQRPSY